MPSAELTRICRELSQMSDTLNISISKTAVKFGVEGEIGGGSISLRHRDTGKNATVLEVTDPVSCSFALRYINIFNKASSLGETVVLSVSDQLPLIMHFEFDLGEIKYYLAPKVSED